jgi:hypothetical protein
MQNVSNFLSQAQSLDEIGISHVTDKSSLVHNYLASYERMLRHLRDQTFTLIEIGVLNGASLRMWADFFPKAKIIGVDIGEGARQYATSRIQIEIGSQDDREFMEQLAKAHEPLVVIDDGSHRADHQIHSFEFVFPFLKPGGCYIIEDTLAPHGAHRAIMLGNSEILAGDYFNKLQRHMMLGFDESEKNESIWYAFRHAESVEALHHAIAIWKAKPIDVSPEHIARLEQVTERLNDHAAFYQFADFLAERVHDQRRALNWMMRAANTAPDSPWPHFRVSVIAKRLGDREMALAAAKRAVARAPDTLLFREHLQKIDAG